MSKDALADLLAEWETMRNGMDDWLAGVPHLRPLRDELAATIQVPKELADEQSSLTARRQVVTQQLRIVKSRGQDLAIKVRAAIRSYYGHRDEGLVRFHIRPVRRRSRAVPEGAGIAVPIPAALPAASPALPEKLGVAPDSVPVSHATDGDSRSEP
jgi:hypothetical protein